MIRKDTNQPINSGFQAIKEMIKQKSHYLTEADRTKAQGILDDDNPNPTDKEFLFKLLTNDKL